MYDTFTNIFTVCLPPFPKLSSLSERSLVLHSQWHFTLLLSWQCIHWLVQIFIHAGTKSSETTTVRLTKILNRQIVSSLHGQIDVESKVNEGTSVSIDLRFPLSQHPGDGIPEDLRENLKRIRGKHLVLLDLNAMYDGEREPTQSVIERENALRSVAENWLQMRVSRTSDINEGSADFYLFSEPPPADDILSHHNKAANFQSSNLEIPLVIVTTDSKEAHMINRNHAVSLEKTGRIVQVLSQP